MAPKPYRNMQLQLLSLIHILRVSALCGLGHSTAVPVLSSLQNFEEVYNRHLDGNDCSICGHDRGY